MTVVPRSCCLPAAFAVAVAVLFAGCAVHIPADAVAATHDLVPGGVVHAWVEQEDGAVVFHGLFRYDGGGYIQKRAGAGSLPWMLEVVDAHGAVVRHSDRDAPTEFWNEMMVSGTTLDFHYIWDRGVHGVDGDRTVAPPGDYTARIGVSLGSPRVDIVAEVPFVLLALQ